jgi:hypothetical protein
LPEQKLLITIGRRGHGMRICIGGPAKQSLHRMIVFSALISLVLPVMPSVLCVAPGSHAAIEALDAGCCAPATFVHGTVAQEEELSASGECRDCTDYVLASPAGRLISRISAAGPETISVECVRVPTPMLPTASLKREQTPVEADTSGLHNSSMPLRC